MPHVYLRGADGALYIGSTRHMLAAGRRERQLKRWTRAKKDALIPSEGGGAASTGPCRVSASVGR